MIRLFPALLAVGVLPLLCGAAARDMAIANHAAMPIVELYVSASDDTSWGDDRLGQTQIAPGASWHLDQAPGAGCTVDVRVVYADGRAEERHAQDICRTHDLAFDAAAAAAPHIDTTRHVTLTNKAPRTIVSAFLSAPTSSDWGEDRLSRPLAPGESVGFDAQGGCIADLRVVYDNRAAEERRRIDICRNQTVPLAPGWTTTDALAPLNDATSGVRPDHRT